ncbi:putative methyltransferase-like protein 15 [Nymphon striatum]|nr:putative methyltransferase-like protein 15 [Nymphon striatum]
MASLLCRSSKTLYTVLASNFQRVSHNKLLSCSKCESYSISTNVVTESEDASHQAHVPVMVEQVMEFLNPTNGKVFLDMTFGAGGHARELLKSADNVTVYALDCDSVAYNLAQKMQNEFPNQVIPLNGKFSDVPRLLQEIGVQKESIDGVLFDVGCSSMQLDNAERGFSYLRDAPLDMRMCRESNEPTAADVINTLEAKDIAKILKSYGEVKQSKKIAQAIIDSKYMMQPVKTTRQLAMLVRSVYTKFVFVDELTSEHLQTSFHMAAQVFQALRIFVNNELNEVEYGIEVAHKYLKENGIIVALSFHSLEDRVVKKNFNEINMEETTSKHFNQNYKNACKTFTPGEMSSILAKKWRVLTKKPIVPTIEEIKLNSRSRSAKLRAAQKVKVSS